MSTVWLILTWIAVVILFGLGLIGIVVPALPGVVLIFAGILLYALVDGFAQVSGGWVLFFAFLTAAVLALDSLAGILGARQFGASRWGLLGSFVGLIVGVVVLSPILGIILGPLVGAVVAELLAGKDARNSLRAGLGTFVGFLGGVVFKIAAAFAMIGIFFYQVAVH